MHGCTLCLAFHCHQPVGNFEHVIADSFARCYHPMLEVFAAHPHVRFGLHWSGVLYDWAEEREARTMDLLQELVERGQVELLGGGYYEPLLPLLPPQDVRAQLEAMQAYVQRRFAQTPTGFWLTERVWEPQLPRLCGPAGLRYTMTDDTHFRAAGLRPDELVGYYLTEDGGETLGVFPVDKGLRYAIPFREPEESIRRLREVAEQRPGSALTYGDDGEKFGLWPDTYDWVYERRYLHRFCEALEREQEWLRILPPGEYLAEAPPTGRIYLPTASYDEMETWALRAEDQQLYDDLLHAELPATERRFLRGGFFRNFLAKYAEANLLHKRMLATSRRVAALDAEDGATARRELWQSQCSCPYWHGLFGGLYLNGIRQAAHSHAIRAGAIADAPGHEGPAWVAVERGDLLGDGHEDVGVRGAAMELWVHPADGGTVSVLDDRRTARMLTDVLARQREGYHAKVPQARVVTGTEAPASIHDIVRAKEAGLEQLLHYDPLPRWSFRDRLLAPEDDLHAAVEARLHDAAGFAARRYACTTEAAGARAHVVLESAAAPRLRKGFTYDDAAGTLTVMYGAPNHTDGRWRFATELNLTLLAREAPDRHLRIQTGGARAEAAFGDTAEHADVTAFELVDEWAGATLGVRCTPGATLWHYPIETVSNSEAGYERTYQGTAFVLVWDWDLTSSRGPTVQLGLHPL